MAGITDIVWADPGPKRGRTTSKRIAAFRDAPVANPGRWAVHPSTSAPAVAVAIRRGRYSAWRPAGAFEAVTRTVDGERHLYVRYVGTEAGK